MQCRVFDLHRKEVVNIRDGTRLGTVGDLEVDTATAKILSLVLYGRLRLFGLLGREEDRVIPWSEIPIIGEDIMLVDTPPVLKKPRQKQRTSTQPTSESTPDTSLKMPIS